MPLFIPSMFVMKILQQGEKKLILQTVFWQIIMLII